LSTLINLEFPNVTISSNKFYIANINTIYWYILIIELLIYIITITQSNLRFALLMLLYYCSNSNSIHIYTITCILRYVKETLY